MKKSTGLSVFALLAAVVAAGCGTENPTGPSMARTAPPVETAASGVELGEEPGTDERGSWTAPEEEVEIIDWNNGQKTRKPKNPRGQGGRR